MPAGFDVTVPEPVPMVLTWRTGFAEKLATTDLAASMVTLQVVAIPEHAPDQPLKNVLACGVAVSVTTLPLLYEPLHVAGHEIPAGMEVTVPTPSPLVTTER